LKNDKGLDTKIIKVLTLKQPFSILSPLNEDLRKKNTQFHHLNYFMDHQIFPQRNKKHEKIHKFACDVHYYKEEEEKKQKHKKENFISLSVQLCLVRCENL